MALTSACLPVTGPKPPKTAASGQELLASAETAYNQGRHQEAAGLYRRFLEVEPHPPRLEAILAAYGLAAEKSGRFDEAARAYERLSAQYSGGEFAGEARFRLVNVHLALGEAAKAENLAFQLRAAETDSRRQAELELALGRSRWLGGRYPEATGNFIAAYEAGGPGRSPAAAGALASLARLDYPALAGLQQRYGQKFPGPEATYLLFYRSAAIGDRHHAAAMADYFRRYFNASSLLAQVEETAAALAAGSALPALAFGDGYDPRREVAASLIVAESPAGAAAADWPGGLILAVALPLSDKSAGRFAQEVVLGLKLAVSDFAAGRLGLNVLDTGGSAERAVQLVRQAAADSQVLAMVGPMLVRESNAAAEAAAGLGLPLIALSQASGLPDKGPDVFRLFLTPRHQAEAVARYAVRAENHQTLGIIYPDDNYGRPLRAYFQDEAARLGAKVTAADGYNPQSPDYETLVARLTGGKAARRVSTDYQAQVGFTALYLPDSAGPAARILPLLAFHDVTRMRFLGSALWLNPELLESSARYLQGAVIPSAFSELSQRPEVRRFEESFSSAYGHAPDQFAAYGYDAGLAVIHALGRGGAAGRADLRQALTRGEATPGVTGPFIFDSGGEYRVEPALLTVRDKEFVLLREPGPAARP